MASAEQTTVVMFYVRLELQKKQVYFLPLTICVFSCELFKEYSGKILTFKYSINWSFLLELLFMSIVMKFYLISKLDMTKHAAHKLILA